MVKVSGTVTIDGEPLPNAMIQVCPTDGKAAFGNADEQGRFSLTSMKPDDGCVTGTHKVVVVAVEEAPGNKQLNFAPLKYGQLSTTDLTLTIDGPMEDAKIELTWDGQTGPIAVSMGSGE